MITGQSKRAAGVFFNRQAAESALHTLRDAGFSMQNVSLIAKDTSIDSNQQRTSYFSDSPEFNIQKGGAKGAVAGGALGGLGGLLAGLSMVAIPGVGPVLAGGALGTVVVTTLAGGGIGSFVGEMSGAVSKLGIPEERAQEYAEQVSGGNYLVMVEGDEQEISRAESILRDRGIREWVFTSSTRV
ncbi:MAG: DUF1269 domain-containing protein [Scytonema sp. PMC 1069.18]|nr:DUF1269 domain-containing protein [Scytonema sp. PMC 1069.18]MEC4881854.1 DUF1269 domain-containing protein [Scytonema sp. PMC 1070.18]